MCLFHHYYAIHYGVSKAVYVIGNSKYAEVQAQTFISSSPGTDFQGPKLVICNNQVTSIVHGYMLRAKSLGI